MKTLLTLAVLGIAAAPAVEQERRPMDVVFCIDRSGSMLAVIETAKRKVWSIVNEISQMKPPPVLRIGLIGYGSADKEFKMFPLSSDLDTVYENLLTFKVDMGGDEWVGLAVKKATDEMAWNREPRGLRTLFVVGNETAAQGRPDVLYTLTVPETIKRDIVVNAVYCGKPNPEEERTWREVASLADGMYTMIDLSGGAVTIETPMDKRMVELNGKLNATYIPFGREGETGKEKQEAQDRNTPAPEAASRAQAKSGGLYRNAGWDLVDASKGKDFDLSKVKAEELPAEMRSMTPEERKAHLEKMTRERESLQKEIAQLGVERQKHIDSEIKRLNLSQDGAFDEAVRKAIRKQADRK